MKQNEKSSALFSEVVRLGEEHEKTAQSLSGLNSELQSRLAALESKTNMFEGNFQSVGERESSTSNLMTDLAEKMEKRVHNLEEVINMLNVEQKTEKEHAQRLEMTTLKNSEEFKSLVS